MNITDYPEKEIPFDPEEAGVQAVDEEGTPSTADAVPPDSAPGAPAGKDDEAEQGESLKLTGDSVFKTPAGEVMTGVAEGSEARKELVKRWNKVKTQLRADALFIDENAQGVWGSKLFSKDKRYACLRNASMFEDHLLMLCSKHGFPQSIRVDGLPISRRLRQVIVNDSDLHCNISLEAAGFVHGVHAPGTMSDSLRVFVPHGMRLPEPKKGDWSLIKDIIEGMLGENPQLMQVDRVHLFTLTAYRRLLNNNINQQLVALFIAGDPGAGKSTYAAQVIGGVLGGRVADAYKFVAGKTEFNADVIAAETWIIDDKTGLIGAEVRRVYSDGVKQTTTGGHKQHRGMRKDNVNICCINTLVALCNSDKQSLQSLPQIFREGVSDKILVLHARKPKRVDLPEDETVRLYEEQVPAYLWWLLNEFKPDPSITSVRFGVAPWISPIVQEDVVSESDGDQFWHMIDNQSPVWATTKGKEYRCKVVELWDAIASDDLKPYRPHRIHNTDTLQIMLEELCKSHPHRVERWKTTERTSDHVNHPSGVKGVVKYRLIPSPEVVEHYKTSQM